MSNRSSAGIGGVRAVAWTCLALTGLGCALFFNSILIRATETPSAATANGAPTVSPAAALVDGDDVRANYLASRPTPGLGAWADPPQKNCLDKRC
jgi:hypothetical protein